MRRVKYVRTDGAAPPWRCAATNGRYNKNPDVTKNTDTPTSRFEK